MTADLDALVRLLGQTKCLHDNIQNQSLQRATCPDCGAEWTNGGSNGPHTELGKLLRKNAPELIAAAQALTVISQRVRELYDEAMTNQFVSSLQSQRSEWKHKMDAYAVVLAALPPDAPETEGRP